METTLSPRALLDALLEIELELGRVRNERWGPRTVDLDLLVYGDVSSTSRACVCLIRACTSGGSPSSRSPSSIQTS